MSFSRVSIIGLGYIGLPTAAVIASRGMSVIGVELIRLQRIGYTGNFLADRGRSGAAEGCWRKLSQPGALCSDHKDQLLFRSNHVINNTSFIRVLHGELFLQLIE